MEREQGTDVGMRRSTPVELAASKAGELYGLDPYSLAWGVLIELERAGFRLLDRQGRIVDIYGELA